VELVDIQGRVTIAGSPCANTLISFEPVMEEGSRARGMTDVDGRYKLRHESGKPGVEPGEYRVVFLAARPRAESEPDSPSWQAYRDPASTPCRASIHAGDRMIDFDLKP
jgi:hypothetical protein